MIKKIAFCIVTTLLFQNCRTHSTYYNDIQLVNGIYLDKITRMPFTGNLLSKFPSGSLATETHLLNGIPNGQWTSYGFDREIIQNGENGQLNIKTNPKEIYRITLDQFQEGNFNYNNIIIIVAKKAEIKKKSKLEEEILSFLRHNYKSIKGEVQIEYKIGELEKSVLESSVII